MAIGLTAGYQFARWRYTRPRRPERPKSRYKGEVAEIVQYGSSVIVSKDHLERAMYDYSQIKKPTMHDSQKLNMVAVGYEVKLSSDEVQGLIIELGMMLALSTRNDALRENDNLYRSIEEDKEVQPLLDAVYKNWKSGQINN